jgi:glycosyltransferase involved in cell wall biosynthesis
MVLSGVGGFPEVAEQGAARLVQPGDPAELAATLNELIADPAKRDELASGAAHAAATYYSWDEIGERTYSLYQRLLS